MRRLQDDTGQGHPHQPPAHHQKCGGHDGAEGRDVLPALEIRHILGLHKLGHDSGLQLRAVYVDPPRTGDDKARARDRHPQDRLHPRTVRALATEVSPYEWRFATICVYKIIQGVNF